MSNRVWIYIISKELNNEDLHSLQSDGNNFVNEWTAHERELAASFEIYKNRIIFVKVDEDVHSASGCSLDKLSRFMKETEKKYSVDLLNRLIVALKIGDKLEIVHSSKIKEMLNNGLISEDTVFYDTTIANESDLKNWEQPLKNSWLKKFIAEV